MQISGDGRTDTCCASTAFFRTGITLMIRSSLVMVIPLITVYVAARWFTSDTALKKAVFCFGILEK